MTTYYLTVLTPKEIQIERLKICKGCANYLHGFCKSCGCLLTLKVKVNKESCPEKKWLAVDNNSDDKLKENE